MTRIKRGILSKKAHRNVLKRTKGFTMSNRRLIKRAQEADLHAGQYAYVGRKLRKRDMRRLWILRVSEAVKLQNWSYNQFIHSLKMKKIELNRKSLAHLVSHHPDVFSQIVQEARKK